MYGRYTLLTAKGHQAGSVLINDARSRGLSPPIMISNRDLETKTRQPYIIISIAVLILFSRKSCVLSGQITGLGNGLHGRLSQDAISKKAVKKLGFVYCYKPRNQGDLIGTA